jgi:hypothetical protein
MHNAIVNSTGLVAIVGLPQFEVLVIMAAIVAFGWRDPCGRYARPTRAQAIIGV